MIKTAKLIHIENRNKFDNAFNINELYTSSYIKSHFDNLSKDYWMSEVFSFKLMSYWRKKALNKIEIKQGDVVLDIMSGTGENAALLSTLVGKNGRVICLDISEKMNEIAQSNVQKKQIENVEIFTKDFLCNEFSAESVDVIVCTFGLKTLHQSTPQPNGSAGSVFSEEIMRLLKPNGKFVLIELSEPNNFIFKQIAFFYLKLIVPILSKILRGNDASHKQLYPFFKQFKNCNQIEQSLKKTGLNTTQLRFTFGLLTGVFGYKKK
jgi:ubiquinone/menaquinone biosynthesis methyltransferase